MKPTRTTKSLLHVILCLSAIGCEANPNPQRSKLVADSEVPAHIQSETTAASSGLDLKVGGETPAAGAAHAGLPQRVAERVKSATAYIEVYGRPIENQNAADVLLNRGAGFVGSSNSIGTSEPLIRPVIYYDRTTKKLFDMRLAIDGPPRRSKPPTNEQAYEQIRGTNLDVFIRTRVDVWVDGKRYMDVGVSGSVLLIPDTLPQEPLEVLSERQCKESVIVGGPVWSYGFTPGDLLTDWPEKSGPGISVTEGVVEVFDTSFLSEFEEIFQHSCQVSHGFSGGPVVNARGHVIAVNHWRHNGYSVPPFLVKPSMATPYATGETRHVNPQDHQAYPTLEAALRNAPAGATIRLSAGRHEFVGGSDTVNHVNLCGAGREQTTLIVRNTLFVGLEAFRNSQRISDLTIEGDCDRTAILKLTGPIGGSDSCVISNVKIVNHADAGGALEIANLQAAIFDSDIKTTPHNPWDAVTLLQGSSVSMERVNATSIWVGSNSSIRASACRFSGAFTDRDQPRSKKWDKKTPANGFAQTVMLNGDAIAHFRGCVFDLTNLTSVVGNPPDFIQARHAITCTLIGNLFLCDLRHDNWNGRQPAADLENVYSVDAISNTFRFLNPSPTYTQDFVRDDSLTGSALKLAAKQVGYTSGVGGARRIWNNTFYDCKSWLKPLDGSSHETSVLKQVADEKRRLVMDNQQLTTLKLPDGQLPASFTYVGE